MGFIGVQDRFGQVGNLDYLVKAYNLSADDICAKVRSLLGK